MMTKVAFFGCLVVLLKVTVEGQEVFLNEVYFDKDTVPNGFAEIVGSPAADETTMKVWVTIKDDDGHPVSAENKEVSLAAGDAEFKGKLVGVESFPAGTHPMTAKGGIGIATTDGGDKTWYCWGEGMAANDKLGADTCNEVISTIPKDASFVLALINKAAAQGWTKADFEWKNLSPEDATKSKPNAGKEGTTELTQVWTGMSASRGISMFSVLTVLAAFLWN